MCFVRTMYKLSEQRLQKCDIQDLFCWCVIWVIWRVCLYDDISTASLKEARGLLRGTVRSGAAFEIRRTRVEE